jgi:hypothetical protein
MAVILTGIITLAVISNYGTTGPQKDGLKHSRLGMVDWLQWFLVTFTYCSWWHLCDYWQKIKIQEPVWHDTNSHATAIRIFLAKLKKYKY